MKNLENRVLGRVLAVEELNSVSGGWTLGSAGDTSKLTDTGAYEIDKLNSIIEMLPKL